MTTLEIDDAQPPHPERQLSLSLVANKSLPSIRIPKIRNPKFEIRNPTVIRPAMNHGIRHTPYERGRVSRTSPINNAANTTHKRFRISDQSYLELHVLGHPDIRHWTLDLRHLVPDFRLWTLDNGPGLRLRTDKVTASTPPARAAPRNKIRPSHPTRPAATPGNKTPSPAERRSAIS